MKSDFVQLKVTRKNFITILDTYNLKKLNEIPRNFHNNIIWNIGHALVTEQLLHYYLSGNSLRIDSFWVDHFKKGTRPTSKYNQDLVDELKELLLQTVEYLIEDYDHNLFLDYKPYTTSYGYEIQNFEDALEFNNMHEALHVGYCLALKNNL